MNRIKLIQNIAAFFAVIMMVFAPMLAASSADAQVRRAGAACGARGCVAARGGYHGGAAACGARGCAAVGRNGAAVVRRPAGVVVVNPHRYWPAGGAIAAGAAIGFVAGAAAASAYGHPPKAGQCWYYTTPAKTSGFWDVCPR